MASSAKAPKDHKGRGGQEDHARQVGGREPKEAVKTAADVEKAAEAITDLKRPQASSRQPQTSRRP